jgi:hypothetical protein
MFVETITTPRDEWIRWNERLRMLTEPPAALIAGIAWQTENGDVTSVNVWDSPEAVADFFVERVHPFVAVEGSPAITPTRHGEPLAVYLREPVSPEQRPGSA